MDLVDFARRASTAARLSSRCEPTCIERLLLDATTAIVRLAEAAERWCRERSRRSRAPRGAGASTSARPIFSCRGARRHRAGASLACPPIARSYEAAFGERWTTSPSAGVRHGDQATGCDVVGREVFVAAAARTTAQGLRWSPSAASR